MSFLFPKDEPEVIPPAIQAARRFLEAQEAELARRAGFHEKFYREFWDGSVTPDEIMEAMGQLGVTFLQTAGASAEHLATLAAIAGKPLTDLVPERYINPRRVFIPNQDGTVTLEPPQEGFDAWGRPIIEE